MNRIDILNTLRSAAVCVCETSENSQKSYIISVLQDTASFICINLICSSLTPFLSTTTPSIYINLQTEAEVNIKSQQQQGKAAVQSVFNLIEHCTFALFPYMRTEDKGSPKSEMPQNSHSSLNKALQSPN